MFHGSIVALVTPMQNNGSIDYLALNDLIEWHIAEKTDAIVIVGTTGESATLSPEEQFELIKMTVKQVAKRIPVIAGTGTNSTKTTLERTIQAKKAGADACLLITPYCNKPTQQGLIEHYRYVADNSSLPIILYNVPSRTGCDLLPETVIKLAKIKNIIGIKEATGKIERATDILKQTGDTFIILSGDDATSLELMLAGAKGVISVTANIAPRQMYELCEAVRNNNLSLAKTLNDKLMPLHKNLFLESNPIPVKWGLEQMGKIPSGIRLPLTPFDAKYHAQLQQAMQHAGIR